MDQIRVVLAGMPRILRDIVASLVKDQPDMIVVAETEATTNLYAMSRMARADVVILGADENVMPAEGRRLVNRAPHLKVLAVGLEGRHAWLYELRPHEQHIGEISQNDLVSAIRDAMRTQAVPMEITGETSISLAAAIEGRRR